MRRAAASPGGCSTPPWPGLRRRRGGRRRRAPLRESNRECGGRRACSISSSRCLASGHRRPTRRPVSRGATVSAGNVALLLPPRTSSRVAQAAWLLRPRSSSNDLTAAISVEEQPGRGGSVGLTARGRFVLARLDAEASKHLRAGSPALPACPKRAGCQPWRWLPVAQAEQRPASGARSWTRPVGMSRGRRAARSLIYGAGSRVRLVCSRAAGPTHGFVCRLCRRARPRP
jgi:hypothetical protein